jgi:hypothetical protein
MNSPFTPSFSDFLPKWKNIQGSYACQPLEFCPEFPRIAARHEAWWRCELEGPPLVLATASNDPSVIGGRCLELLTRPNQWLEARLRQLKATTYVGDALPSVRVDYGPVCLGMLTGAPVEFISDTAWTHSFIKDDWSNEPDWQIHEDNPWWQLLAHLLQINAENVRGRCLVMTPTLGGPADLLLNTRGPNQLCIDVLEQPEKIGAAIEAIYLAWQKGFERIWKVPMSLGVGTINWVGLWSNVPYCVLECDFNYMIGPRAFQKLFLPDIARQGRAVGRSIFHLDGPGAARHYQALLDTPEITAIQYVTGAGNSAMAHLEMLQQIQQHGRPLQVTVPVYEAVELSRHLNPRGLCLLIEEIKSPAEIEAIYQEICHPFIGKQIR